MSTVKATRQTFACELTLATDRSRYRDGLAQAVQHPPSGLMLMLMGWTREECHAADGRLCAFEPPSMARLARVQHPAPVPVGRQIGGRSLQH